MTKSRYGYVWAGCMASPPYTMFDRYGDGLKAPPTMDDKNYYMDTRHSLTVYSGSVWAPIHEDDLPDVSLLLGEPVGVL